MSDDRKKIIGTILALAIFSVIGPMIFLRSWQSSVAASDQWMKSRLTKGVESLPKIADTPMDTKLMLVIGSSEVESSFNPLAFDPVVSEKVGKFVSYNLGFRNINIILRKFSDQIVQDFSTKDRKADLILVKVMPSNLTKRARNGFAETLVRDTTVGIFFSPLEMAQLLLSRPERGLFLLFYGKIFGGMTAYQVAAILKRMLYTPPLSLLSENERLELERRETYIQFWGTPDLHPRPGWNSATRGFFKWGLPKSQRTFEKFQKALQTPALKRLALESHILRHDILDLDLSPESVNEFLTSIRLLKSIAKKVVVFYVPLHPIVNQSALAKERQNDFFRMIRSNVEVDLWDYSKDSVFEEGDFIDDVHLNQAGSDKLLKLLSVDTIKSFSQASSSGQ